LTHNKSIMKKRFYTLLITILMSSFAAQATHYMGGEIIWECLPNGNFRFTLIVYRECAGITYPNTINMASNSPAGNISMSLYPNAVAGRVDLSPDCNDDPMFQHIDCASTPFGTAYSNSGAVEEWTYTSDAAYPNGVQLNGVPPANGWYFAYTSCCRNPCSNIPGSSSMSWYLRAIMYPYTDPNTGLPVNNYPCWDDSPTFIEKPSTVICTGYPFTYNHNAYDKQLDSLVFEWASPLNNNINSPITAYNAGYSALSPLPGIVHNPNNVPAVVNPHTGEISFTSFTQGAFVTVTKVSAYKCGQLIAEIFREMQIVLLTCGANYPPSVPAPFQNSQGQYVLFTDTVYAGQHVNFYFSAIDTLPVLLANGDLSSVTLTASGSQFGQGYTSTTTGCLNPPCATLTPPPPITQFFGLNTTFDWETSCAHLETTTGCGGVTNSYNFILKVMDDFCPAPGINISTIGVVVVNAILEEPDLRCISVDEAGDVDLSWIPPDTSIIPNTFNSYHIYSALNPLGPYILIDSIFDYNTTTYTHLGANAAVTPRYYYLRTRSGCYGGYYSDPTDTLRTINLSVANIGNNTAELNWNHNHQPLLPTALGMYEVYFENDAGVWVTVGTTPNLTYQDVVPAACGFLKYRVAMEDSSGCFSYSSIDEDMFRSAVPPELRCTQTDLNGDVTLHWTMPTDSVTLNNFASYYIYQSPSPGGPYILLDSVLDVMLNTYTHIGANGNSTQHYYSMVTNVDCDGLFSSDFSDTLSNIVLNLTMTSSQSASLNWNPPANPLFPSHSGLYYVYREYPPGFWEMIDSTVLLTFADTMLICHDTVNYRVEMYDSSGCYTLSSIAGDFFYDDVYPDIPRLDSVSVDPFLNIPILGWRPSVAGDVVGYIVYHNDGVWNPVDTIWGPNITYYEDYTPAHNPCAGPQSYALASLDSCGYTSPMGIDNIHSSIYLVMKNYDPCRDQISLEWTPYENLDPSVAGYRVFMSENGSAFSLLAGTPVGSNHYEHRGLNRDSEYCYFVQAYSDSGYTARSCEVCVIAEKASPPDFLFIRYATVKDNDHIHLQMFADTNAATDYYKILRAASVNGPYEEIGTVPFLKQEDFFFEDHKAFFKRQSYFYKIVAVDTCGVDSYTSELARSIFLTAEINDNFSNVLEWNDYEGWSWAPLKDYNIFRIVDGMRDPIPVAVLPYGTTSYIDDVSGLVETEGKFSYQIEALQGPGNPNFADTSLSNIADLLQRSRVFLPNAFSPKGYNANFKPGLVFVDLSEYEFRIFNRWGQELFQTKDPERAWDGRYEGSFVPGGAYVYYVRFITSKGKEYEKRGSVTVVY